jgi:hypothetical protein
MDKDGNEKSNVGNDKNLKTEPNPVTGVKTNEPRSDRENAGTRENPDDTKQDDTNRNNTNRNDKSKTATGGSKE